MIVGGLREKEKQQTNRFLGKKNKKKKDGLNQKRFPKQTQYEERQGEISMCRQSLSSGQRRRRQSKVCNRSWKGARSPTLLLVQHLTESGTSSMPPPVFSWNTSSSFTKEITDFTICIRSLTTSTRSITAFVYSHSPLLSTEKTISFKILVSSLQEFGISCLNCKNINLTSLFLDVIVERCHLPDTSISLKYTSSFNLIINILWNKSETLLTCVHYKTLGTSHKLVTVFIFWTGLYSGNCILTVQLSKISTGKNNFFLDFPNKKILVVSCC